MQQNDIQNARIQGLLARYLELRPAGTSSNVGSSHLDEDTLSAFTEGRVSDREATPVILHLTDCNFCRHRTVELVRLDLNFADLNDASPVRETSAEPASISSVLSGILARIFGTNDAAVFAHEERKDESEQEVEPTGTDSKE
jgi:hypothetical protein